MKLIDYIFGSRRGREANRIERDAMTDPFLADAIEGYDSVYGNHSDRLAELTQLVERRSLKLRRMRRNRRSITTVAWSAAAVVAIGAGITLLYIYEPGAKSKSLPIAVNTASSESQPAAQMLAMEGEEGISVSSLETAVDSMEQAADMGGEVRDRSSVPVGSDPAQEQMFMMLDFAEEEVSADGVHEVRETTYAQKASTGETPLRTAPVSRALSDEVAANTAGVVENPDFIRYFRKNRKITADEEGKPARGTVVAEFRVNDRGVPSEIRIVAGITSRINREVIELLISGPAWEPTDGVRIRVVLKYE